MLRRNYSLLFKKSICHNCL